MYNETTLEVTSFGEKALKKVFIKHQIQNENMMYQNLIYWLNESIGVMVT